MLSSIKTDALHNLPIVQKPYNEDNICKVLQSLCSQLSKEEDLRSLCAQLSKEVNATQKDRDLIVDPQKVKQIINEMRNEINVKLDNFKKPSKKYEMDPKKPTKTLPELIEVYFQQNKMLSLVKSVALHNAAIVRQPDNANDIDKDLKLLCSQVLREANATKKDADLIAKSKEVKQKIKEMRKKVNNKLSELKALGKKYETEEEMENAKILDIRNLQEEISTGYSEIMAELSQYCETVMGNPPCKFSVVGMGSLARKEITPYSDFEHIIVLDNEIEKILDYESVLNYFRWFTVIFHIVVINLQETIIPSVAIECLKYSYTKKKNWFYDNLTTRGICFDGMMPHACKFPLGIKKRDENRKIELIKPVDEMVKLLTFEEDLKNGYHLKDILTKICYVAGDDKVYKTFETKVHMMLNNQHEDEENLKEIEKILIEDLEKFATRSNLLKVEKEKSEKKKKSYDIKKDFYRSTTLFISTLGRIHNIDASSCFDVVEKLEEKKLISAKAKRKQMYAVALACELRLKCYMKKKDKMMLLNRKVKNLLIKHFLSL